MKSVCDERVVSCGNISRLQPQWQINLHILFSVCVCLCVHVCAWVHECSTSSKTILLFTYHEQRPPLCSIPEEPWLTGFPVGVGPSFSPPPWGIAQCFCRTQVFAHHVFKALAWEPRTAPVSTVQGSGLVASSHVTTGSWGRGAGWDLGRYGAMVVLVFAYPCLSIETCVWPGCWFHIWIQAYAWGYMLV